MQLRDGARVNAVDGPLGVISSRSEDPDGRITIVGQNGQEVLVPISVLAPQSDGSWSIGLSMADLSAEPSGLVPLTHVAAGRDAVVPVIAEELDVDKRQVRTGGVRVHKLIHAHDEVVSMPLTRDHVDVRRVVIGRDVDAPLPIRREGDTLIVPVVEEVLIVEKRWRLKEELHVTRRTITEQHEETVTLQREEAVIQRLDAGGQAVREEVPSETMRQHAPQPAEAPRRRRGPFLRDD